jgi:hypothetical protein
VKVIRNCAPQLALICENEHYDLDISIDGCDVATYFARFYSYAFYAYLFGISGWWRNFARLPGDFLGAPIYVTDILLALGLLVVGALAVSSTDWRKYLLPLKLRTATLPALLLALLCLIPLRVIPAYPEFGFQALRDGVMLLYLLFIPIMFWLRDHLSLRVALISIYLGQCAGILSYYIISHVFSMESDFLFPLSNEAVAVLPFVGVLLFFNRWASLGTATFALAPIMLSQLFWLKRSLLLGTAFLVICLMAYRPTVSRNLVRLFIASFASLIFSIGLLYAPSTLRPLLKDSVHIIEQLSGPGPQAEVASVPEPLQKKMANCSATQETRVASVVGEEFEGPSLLHGEDLGGEGFMSWRLYLWRQAWNDIVEKPLWGWGFGPKVVKTLPGGKVLTEENFISGPHNAYITVIFRLGFPLFVIFIGVPLCFLCRALSARQRVDATQVLALAVIGFSYFNAFFSLGFESPQNSVPAYVLMGLLLAPLWQIGQIAGTATDNEPIAGNR